MKAVVGEAAVAVAVKLTSGGATVSSLTSPPPQPIPYPPDELIAEKVQYQDREVLVTIPLPDTIVLVTDVYNHHLSQPDETGGSAIEILKKLDREMTEKVAGYKDYESYSPFPASHVKAGKRAIAVFKLPFDPDQPLWRAELAIQRRPIDDYGIWSVRLEFSLDKAGPGGVAKLTSLLDEVLDLNIERLFATMRVRRLDAAIDLIGVEPIDLISHVKKPGKRLLYIGDHGRPETVYFYERKNWLLKPPGHLGVKTIGPARLTLYERRSYYQQLGLKPVWGPAPVTRAEVRRIWKKNEPMLAELAELKKNPFVGCRVGYASALAGAVAPQNPSAWLRFCLAALGGGTSKTQAKTGLVQGAAFRKAYDACTGDLVNESMWCRWKDGLKYSGLDKWVQAANQHS